MKLQFPASVVFGICCVGGSSSELGAIGATG